MGHWKPLFIYFRLFNTADNKQTIVQYKFCRWLESNRRPLISKATALPTEPQPLPLLCFNFLNKIRSKSAVNWNSKFYLYPRPERARIEFSRRMCLFGRFAYLGLSSTFRRFLFDRLHCCCCSIHLFKNLLQFHSLDQCDQIGQFIGLWATF